jgi:hypothetical protein
LFIPCPDHTFDEVDNQQPTTSPRFLEVSFAICFAPQQEGGTSIPIVMTLSKTNETDEEIEQGDFYLQQHRLVAMRLRNYWFIQNLEGPNSCPTSFRTGRSPRSKLRARRRRNIRQLFGEMGDSYFRRAYRMTKEKFNELLVKLTPYMNISAKSSSNVIAYTRSLLEE